LPFLVDFVPFLEIDVEEDMFSILSTPFPMPLFGSNLSNSSKASLIFVFVLDDVFFSVEKKNKQIKSLNYHKAKAKFVSSGTEQEHAGTEKDQ